MKKITIGITMGDVCGVGPEIIVKALKEYGESENFTPVIFGDRGIIEHASGLFNCNGEVEMVDLTHFPLNIIEKHCPSKETGEASVKYINTAIEQALSGNIDAIVTAPISKQSIHMAGYPWPGHTELFKEATGVDTVSMMFDGGKFRVLLVTIHVPFQEIPKLLTKQTVYEKIIAADKAMREMCGIEKPKIAVAALNPHGGEAGAFGNEEGLIIRPAIEEAQGQGLDVEGPIPADTLFIQAQKGRWDFVVSMYHDQGLIPFKMLYFDEGVNVTVGLPFVRTSPDHGTAFDIAWSGAASHKSMLSAIRLAVDYVARRETSEQLQTLKKTTSTIS